MGRISILLSSVFISLFVGQATAHQPLPSVSWCSGHDVTVRIVGEFRFSRAVLENYRTCLRNGTCLLPIRVDSLDLNSPTENFNVANKEEESPLAMTDENKETDFVAPPHEPGMPSCRSPKDCGETDDDWMVGTRVASSFCSSYQKPRPSSNSDVGSVILNVTAPQSYNALTHHTSYSITAGLEGQCLRCEARK
jgi:hypothetical protein